MDLPLHPLVLLGLPLAMLAVALTVSRLGGEVRSAIWPLTEGMTTPDIRGRDLRLMHLARLLHADDMHEAHRELTALVELRLATEHGIGLADQGAARVLGPELYMFLTAPPLAPIDGYLTALDGALERLERL